MRHFSGWVIVLLLFLTTTLAGQDIAAADKEAETAALQFVRTHHPELAGLLDQLRMNAPKEYDAAITDLTRSRERLEKTRDRLPDRYDLELAEWKLNSRIRLLAARMAMANDDELDAELRSALRERTEIRVKLLQEERDRTAKRVQKLEDQIADQQAQADKIVAKELAAIQRELANTAAKSAKAAKARESGAPTAKPAAKSDPKKSADKPKTNAESKPKPVDKK